MTFRTNELHKVAELIKAQAEIVELRKKIDKADGVNEVGLSKAETDDWSHGKRIGRLANGGRK